MERPDPRFKLEDAVRVIPGGAHSERTGWVCDVVWHFKHECYYYFIAEPGVDVARRKVPTRYSELELELAESPRTD